MTSSSFCTSTVFCRVCLSSDSILVDIFSTRLNDALYRLTGIPCAVGDGLPRSLCFLCAALLRKCLHFRAAALATDRLLRDMAGRGSQAFPNIHIKEVKLHDMCSTAPMVYSYPDLNPIETENIPSDTEDATITGSVVPDASVMTFEVPLVCKFEMIRDSDDERPQVEVRAMQNVASPLLLDAMKCLKGEKTVGTSAGEPPAPPPRRDSDAYDRSEDSSSSSTGESLPPPIKKFENRGPRPSGNGPFIYNCSMCKYKSNILPNYKRHLQRHTDEKCYECQECKKRFKAKAYLRNHLRKQHTEKPFECPKCMYISASAAQLKVHFRKHTFRRSDAIEPRIRRPTLAEQYPSLQCTHCGLTLSTARCLKLHLEIHTGEKPHQCTTCGAKFRQLANLRKHCLRHTGEKPFKCTDCDYRCNVLSDLQTHIRRHTGEKPYKCTECKYTCATSSNLRAHLRRHSGIKPFQCTHCLKNFATKSQLNGHLLTHTGEKPYNCGECGTRFGRLEHYKRHLRRNARVEPFSCSQCAYSCALKCGSTRHLAEHGGN